MSGKKKSEIQQEKDVAFIKAINDSLDTSVDQLDELNAHHLHNIRLNALSKQQLSVSNKRIQYVVAASFLLVFALPAFWYQHTKMDIEQDMEIMSQDIPPEAQDIEDMDMLMAMDDTNV